MSKLLSLKLREDVLREAERIVRKSGKPRNAYFNEAIGFYNRLWERNLLKNKLRAESALVAKDSLEVLEVFERFEDEIA